MYSIMQKPGKEKRKQKIRSKKSSSRLPPRPRIYEAFFEQRPISQWDSSQRATVSKQVTTGLDLYQRDKGYCSRCLSKTKRQSVANDSFFKSYK